MVVVTPLPIRLEGEVLAENISFEDFLKHDEWEHAEWINGWAIKMPGIDERHDILSWFLRTLITEVLERLGGGRVLQDPALIRTKPGLPARAPDIQVLLPDRLYLIQKKFVAGAPNLVIEIVSESSGNTDRAVKLNEYEQGGIPEYWIVDHEFEEVLFYQMDNNGQYQRIKPDEQGIYRSKALAPLSLPVAVLWRQKLPSLSEIMELVNAMFKDESA